MEALKMPYFHMGHDQMQDDQTDETDKGGPMGEDGKADGGDGMHHHEIHENEGGGYTSKHTGPDGKVIQGDHATYEDAKADMDQACGQGGDDEEGMDSADMGDDDGADMSAEDDGNDVAGHYGRAGRG